MATDVNSGDNWLADILGEGAAFQNDTDPNRYREKATGIYDNAIQNKKAELGNVENSNLSKNAQVTAQNGITGPAAAALQHNAVQASEHQGNVATNDLEAQARQAEYQGALQDTNNALAKEAAKQQAYANMGKKGMSLLGGALSLGTGAGLITAATPFFGGLAKAFGNKLLPGSIPDPQIPSDAIDKVSQQDIAGDVSEDSTNTSEPYWWNVGKQKSKKQ